MFVNDKIARATWSIDPETWDLTWKIARGGGIKPGDLAGTVARIGKKQYVQIEFKENRYYAHQLIWLITLGEWPECDIVHIDGNGLNNHIENLILKNDDSAGWCRVRLSKLDSQWHASIKVRGKEVLVGRFTEFDDASEAAKKAAKNRYGFHSTLRTS
jgi:hypothetical protein